MNISQWPILIAMSDTQTNVFELKIHKWLVYVCASVSKRLVEREDRHYQPVPLRTGLFKSLQLNEWTNEQTIQKKKIEKHTKYKQTHKMAPQSIFSILQKDINERQTRVGAHRHTHISYQTEKKRTTISSHSTLHWIAALTKYAWCFTLAYT